MKKKEESRDYYNILELSQNATSQEIEDSYDKLSVYQHHLGSSDYDNMHEQLRVNSVSKAYGVLSNRTARLRYDIRMFDRVEYLDANFSDEAELDSLISVMLEELNLSKLIMKSKDKHIRNLGIKTNLEREETLKQKTDLEIKIELEKSKVNDKEKEVEGLLDQILKLTGEIEVLEDVKKRMSMIESKAILIEKQNSWLLNLARKHRNILFKSISIVVAIFLLIIFLLFVNI